eukprot:m.60481 g.60481  ORF g.60481 m.60481 type:complete len:69 (-) comp11819_c0_seq4:2056-2262(-)
MRVFPVQAQVKISRYRNKGCHTLFSPTFFLLSHIAVSSASQRPKAVMNVSSSRGEQGTLVMAQSLQHQ